MNKALLKKGFSSRLHDALIANGHFSTRSSTGVSLKALAEAIGCSITMARKYIFGKSLPEPDTLSKIAVWLNVNPDWLLHGKSYDEGSSSVVDNIEDQNFIKFILLEACNVLSKTENSLSIFTENIDFILDIYYQTQSLQSSLDEKKKIATWMVHSITHKLKSPSQNQVVSLKKKESTTAEL